MSTAVRHVLGPPFFSENRGDDLRRVMRRLVLVSLFLCTTIMNGSAAVPPPAPGQELVADVVARVSPSVVRIIVVHPPKETAATGTQVAEADAGKGKSAPTGMAELTPNVHVGSGFSIGPGLIATNRHVVEGAVLMYVSTADGARYPAEVVGVSRHADIALIRIDPASNLPPLKFGDSDTVRPGDVVIAIGSPFGFDNTVTAGIVSSVNRDIMESPFDDYIQSDAAINHGNSGGPLFNIAGDVIGMNSVLFAPGQGFSGLGFSIPSNDLRFVLDRIEKYGEVRGGMLPIRTQQVTGLMAEALDLPKPGGALVASVSDGANLMQGQIRPGDVIASINGKPVSDPRDLARKAAIVPLNSVVKLALWRSGKEMSVDVPISPLDANDKAGKPTMGAPSVLGLHFSAMDAQHHGARLTTIDPTGTASDSGLMKGDVILQVQQLTVGSPDQAMQAIQKRIDAKEKFTALLVERDGKASWFPIALPN
jgi:serine protease Do